MDELEKFKSFDLTPINKDDPRQRQIMESWRLESGAIVLVSTTYAVSGDKRTPCFSVGVWDPDERNGLHETARAYGVIEGAIRRMETLVLEMCGHFRTRELTKEERRERRIVLYTCEHAYVCLDCDEVRVYDSSG
jgi:hypothetical protein